MLGDTATASTVTTNLDIPSSADMDRLDELFRDKAHDGLLDDPVKWDEAWTRDLERRWGRAGDGQTTGTRYANFAMGVPRAAMEELVDEDALLGVQDGYRHVSTWQKNLATDVTSRSAWEDFESSWRVLTDKRRREIVLEGLLMAMKAPNSHVGRGLCPESTLDNLCSKDGETYLEYLRQILPADLSDPLIEPRTIPNRAVDEYLSVLTEYADKPGYKGFARFMRLARVMCLTSILREIFCSFVRTVHLSELQSYLTPSTCAVRGSFAWNGASAHPND